MIQKAVDLDPENKDARISLGKISLVERAPEKAMEQADAVLAKDTLNVDGTLLKAMVHFTLREYEKGENLILDLYKSGVSSPDMFILLFSVAGFRQDKERMRAYLREGIEKNQDHIPLILSLAQLEADDKNYEAVETDLRKVIALQPDEVQYKLNLARMFMIQNKSQEAEKIIKEGLQQTPGSLDYHLFLAEMYARSNRVDDAEAILRKAIGLKTDPAHPEIIKSELALANLLLARAKIKEGEGVVDEVIKNDPKNVDAHFLKGKLYLSRNDGINAVNEFMIVTEGRPQVVEGHMNLARAHIINKKPGLEKDVLEKAYAKLPDSTLGITSLVKLYTDTKDYDSALKLCNDRLNKNDQEAFTLNLLGSINMVKKDLEKAKTAFEKAVAIQPDWGSPYENLAKVYLLKGEKDNALKKLKTAIEKDPGNVATWMLLGNLYEKDKANDKAAQTYLQAFEKNPDMWAAANNYAFIMSELSKDKESLQKAMDIAIKAEKLNPGAGIIKDTVGWIYFKMGNIDQAYASILKALEQNPEYGLFNYHMGVILNALGKTKEAKLYLEKSVASNNSFFGAENAKQLLGKYKTGK
ncbi:MAG: tetratricopeptide repeat protein [Desulfobacula sp.]|jgi:tetratricopeptide (TPR) repeat protein